MRRANGTAPSHRASVCCRWSTTAMTFWCILRRPARPVPVGTMKNSNCMELFQSLKMERDPLFEILYIYVICVYVYIYMYNMYVCICVCVCIYGFWSVYILYGIYTPYSVYIYTYIYIRVCVYVHVYVCVWCISYLRLPQDPMVCPQG